MMKPLQLITSLILLVSLTSAHIGGGQMFQDVSPHMYCGRVLARALAMICFEEEGIDKRSEGTMYNAILPHYYKDQDSQLYPWVSPQKAMTMEYTPRGKRQGIVNECCHKACSITELQSYC